MSLRPTKAMLTGSVGMHPSYEQIDIFSAPPASRSDDLDTAKAAGETFEGEVGAGLRKRVLDAFVLNGPMTDETLERLPAFQECAPSTVRKRRSELLHMDPPKLVLYGEVTNRRGKRMKVWAIKAAA